MFICAELLQDVKVGEMVIVKYDDYTKTLGAFLITGEKVGEITSNQAEGCLDFWTIVTRIGNNRVICRVVIKGGRLLILSTDSKILAFQPQVEPAVIQSVAQPLFAMRRQSVEKFIKILPKIRNRVKFAFDTIFLNKK